MQRHRVIRHSIFCLLVLLTAPGLHAQTNEAEVRARLLKNPLFLRGTWVKNTLKFDSQGQLAGKSKPGVFTLAGIDVTDVEFSPTTLKILGQRMGITFDRNLAQRMPLQPISIEIAAPAGGDYTQALDAIFVSDLSHMRPFAPSYWQQYLAKNFPSDDPLVSEPEPQVRKPGGAVKSPELLNKVEPKFNDAARSFKHSGVTTVRLVVNTQGKPENVHILRPVGLGLDDAAVAAVTQYRFQPAMENGSPVPVEVNVEINFDIH
jgi:TonB family protein